MKERTVFLKGKLVALRPVEEGDIPIITKWLNDEEVTYYMFYGQLPMSTSQVAKMINEQVESPNNVVLIIEDRKTNKPIGFGGLYDIHPRARKAEFRILIGEKDYWGKGYGTEATELLTFYGFDRLHLNRIWLGVTDENKAAVSVYKNVGYKVEGVLRQDIYRNSRYYNSIRMSILREEYYPKLYQKHNAKFGQKKG